MISSISLVIKLGRLIRRYTVLTKAQRAWVADLRSGKFKQTRYKLQGPNGYCCLGVACMTFERITGKSAEYEPGVISRILDGGSLIAQREVMKWLGLKSECGFSGKTSLTELNDGMGMSFNEIADFIEDNAEKIFKKK